VRSLVPKRRAIVRQVAWFETAELPPVPFRTAPWVEITAEPETWREWVLRDLRFGPAGLYWQTSLIGARWLAKRIAPPEV